ncbi:MAG: hypothetical protein IT288_17240 [Bdellovibrionales bacterium]|nr:hypothetical protein [Bdellovibrionales bacterium]
MWKVTLFIVLLWCFGISADDVAPVNTLNQINRALKQGPECRTCPDNLPGQNRPSPRLACLAELCPEGHGKLFAESRQASSVVLNDDEDKRLVEFVRQSFAQELRAQSASLQRMSDFLKAKRKIADPQAVQMANVGHLLFFANRIVYDNDGKLDRKATQAALPQFEAKEVDLMIAIFEKMEFSALQVSTVEFLREAYPLYIQRYSSRQINQHVRSAVDVLDKLIPKIEASWGLPSEALLELKRQDSLGRIRNGTFDHKDIEDLGKDLRTGMFFYLLGQDQEILQGVRALPVRADRVLGANPAATIDTRIQYIQTFLAGKERRDSLGLAETEREVIEVCLNALRSARHFDPSSEQRKAFPKKLEAIRTTFIKSLKPYASSHSSSTIDATLAGLKVALPPTYPEYRALLHRRLKDDFEGTARMAAMTRQLASQKPELVAAVDIFYGNATFQNDPNYGGDVKEVCQENFLSPTNDSTSLGLDGLTVSQSSVRDDKMGSAVLMHEFGHQVSRLVRATKLSSATQGWYNRVRSCLREGNQGDNYVEEDWADLAESLSGSSYSFCSTMTNSDRFFTLISTENDETYAHSSPLFRLLNNTLTRAGSIPKSCERAIADRGESFKLRNCTNPR